MNEPPPLADAPGGGDGDDIKGSGGHGRHGKGHSGPLTMVPASASELLSCPCEVCGIMTNKLPDRPGWSHIDSKK